MHVACIITTYQFYHCYMVMSSMHGMLEINLSIDCSVKYRQSVYRHVLSNIITAVVFISHHFAIHAQVCSHSSPTNQLHDQ